MSGPFFSNFWGSTKTVARKFDNFLRDTLEGPQVESSEIEDYREALVPLNRARKALDAAQENYLVSIFSNERDEKYLSRVQAAKTLLEEKDSGYKKEQQIFESKKDGLIEALKAYGAKGQEAGGEQKDPRRTTANQIVIAIQEGKYDQLAEDYQIQSPALKRVFIRAAAEHSFMAFLLSGLALLFSRSFPVFTKTMAMVTDPAVDMDAQFLDVAQSNAPGQVRFALTNFIPEELRQKAARVALETSIDAESKGRTRSDSLREEKAESKQGVAYQKGLEKEARDLLKPFRQAISDVRRTDKRGGVFYQLKDAKSETVKAAVNKVYPKACSGSSVTVDEIVLACLAYYDGVQSALLGAKMSAEQKSVDTEIGSFIKTMATSDNPLIQAAFEKNRSIMTKLADRVVNATLKKELNELLKPAAGKGFGFF